MTDLTLVHRQSHSDLSQSQPEALVWKTCLRQIGFLPADTRLTNLDPADEILTGIKANTFLLEVICGLHSPVLAETEVLGQFKRFLDQVEASSHIERSDVVHLGRDLLKHAKGVRSKHLQAMGSRSYGGLVRHYCKGYDHITILGAGHLTQQMIPLLTKNSQVDIVCRNVAKAKAQLGNPKSVRFFSIEETLPALDTNCAGLVVAAPLEAERISEWIHSQSRSYETIVDLRKESSTDSLQSVQPLVQVIALNTCFAEIEEHSEALNARIKEAKVLITNGARALHLKETYRPFGWEDLCA